MFNDLFAGQEGIHLPQPSAGVEHPTRQQEHTGASQSVSYTHLDVYKRQGTSTVLCLGLHSIRASWLPTSFLMRLSSSLSSLHAITLQWQRKMCIRDRNSP